jgi:hypothetical protein
VRLRAPHQRPGAGAIRSDRRFRAACRAAAQPASRWSAGAENGLGASAAGGGRACDRSASPSSPPAAYRPSQPCSVCWLTPAFAAASRLQQRIPSADVIDSEDERGSGLSAQGCDLLACQPGRDGRDCQCLSPTEGSPSSWRAQASSSSEGANASPSSPARSWRSASASLPLAYSALSSADHHT